MIGATLFSGIGAPEVAMPHWHWAWHAEIEKFPRAVMTARHPGSINLGDVTADDFTERAAAAGRPDVLVFGSPCQDFSVAGKRLGLDGARGNLALTALRIVAQLKPRWFVFENVPGLLSNWSGAPESSPVTGECVEGDENSDFAAFIGTVDELRYSGAWASLDAQYRGLAQRRDRLFFVGHSGDWRGPAAVLFEPESLCGHSPPRRASGQDAALPVTSRVDRGGSHREAQGNNLIANPLGAKKDGGWRGDLDHDTFAIQAGALRENPLSGPDGIGVQTSVAYTLEARPEVQAVAMALNAKGGSGRCDGESETFVAFNNTGQGWWNDSEVASPIRTPEGSGSKEATLIAHALRADGFDASEDGTGRGTPLIATAFKRAQIGKPYDRTDYKPGLSGTLSRYDPECIAFQCQGSNVGEMGVLRAGNGNETGGVPFIAFSGKDYGADAGEIAPTLRAMGHAGSHPNAGGQIAIASTLAANANKGQARGGKTPTLTNPVYERGGVRRLTPRECERLQGFPDDYTLISFRKKPAADGPRYKALGNSMAVPIIRWILNRIEIFERDVRPLIERAA